MGDSVEVDLKDRCVIVNNVMIVRIQALWRGYSTRKHLRRLRGLYSQIFDELEESTDINLYWPCESYKKPLFLRSSEYQVKVKEDEERKHTLKTERTRSAASSGNTSTNSANVNEMPSRDTDNEKSQVENMELRNQESGVLEQRRSQDVKPNQIRDEPLDDSRPVRILESMKEDKASMVQNDTVAVHGSMGEHEGLIDEDIISMPSKQSNFVRIDQPQKTVSEAGSRSNSNASRGSSPISVISEKSGVTSDVSKVTHREINGHDWRLLDTGYKQDGVGIIQEEGQCNHHEGFEDIQTIPKELDENAGESDYVEQTTPVLRQRDGPGVNAEQEPVRMSGLTSAGSQGLENTLSNHLQQTSYWESEKSVESEQLDISGMSSEELKKQRSLVGMELLWVQQAIESRKQYLRLKADISA